MIGSEVKKIGSLMEEVGDDKKDTAAQLTEQRYAEYHLWIDNLSSCKADGLNQPKIIQEANAVS